VVVIVGGERAGQADAKSYTVATPAAASQRIRSGRQLITWSAGPRTYSEALAKDTVRPGCSPQSPLATGSRLHHDTWEPFA